MRTRTVGVLGAVGVAVIAVMLLRGDVDLVGAASRAGVLLGLVLVVERLLLPVAQLLVGSPAVPEPDAGAPEGTRAT